MNTQPAELLLQRQEVAELLHISPAGVEYLARRRDDFPAPVKTLQVRGSRVRVWWQVEITEWAAVNGYLGRGALTAARARAQDAPPRGSAGRSGPIYAVPTRRAPHYARRAT